MQATLPPVWSEIERYRRRRGRVTLAELTEITARAHRLHLQMLHLPPQELRRLRELRARLDWPKHRPELLLYTPQQLRQLIRLGSAAAESVPHPPRPTPTSSWRPGPLGAPWHLPDNNPSSEPRSASGEWVWPEAWGWAAGALLLVAALLLMHATDRFIIRSFLGPRRRRSEEWPTPNVLATSQQNSSNVEMDIPPEDTYPSDSSSAPDLPPSYSACKLEDPPPPYSACQVTFSHPKQEPSVRFYTQHDCEGDAQIAHSSNGFNLDTGQNPRSERNNKIPYMDRETDDSDDCNGDGISDSLECVSAGTAPMVSGELSIDIQDGDESRHQAC